MSDGPDSQNTSAEFLFGDSKMIALLRAFDWSQTVLGPISDWPVEVKTVVAMMMYSPLPMLALFGEHGTMIYNDAYANFRAHVTQTFWGQKRGRDGQRSLISKTTSSKPFFAMAKL